MCWNSTVSLNTFMVGIFAVIFGYYNEVITIYESLLYISFISMQLIEYFTWKNLDNKKINKILSHIGLFAVTMQPLLMILSVYNGPYKTLILMIYLLFISSVILYLYKGIDFSMNKASNGHLAWNWLNFPFIIILIVFIFWFGPLFYNKEFYKLTLYLFIVSVIYYTYHKSHTWGSLWCWIANILSFFLIIRVFYKDFCTLDGPIF